LAQAAGPAHNAPSSGSALNAGKCKGNGEWWEGGHLYVKGGLCTREEQYLTTNKQRIGGRNEKYPYLILRWLSLK